MIERIKLKFGSSIEQPATVIETTPITVFVGPNNSGKSKILIEIEQFCTNGTINTNNLILQDIDFDSLVCRLRIPMKQKNLTMIFLKANS